MQTPTNSYVTDSSELEDSWFNWNVGAPQSSKRPKKREASAVDSTPPSEDHKRDEELNDSWFSGTQE